jgi:MFS family permease
MPDAAKDPHPVPVVAHPIPRAPVAPPSAWSPWRTLRGSLALLGTPRFGTFWTASLLSSIGTWTQQVAEPWLLLSLGASSFLVGLDSFAATAPVWLLSLWGGALADRADRRRIIARFQSLQMLCPIAIIALITTGLVRPWIIIVLSVVVGMTDALSMPSFQSIVPTIVEHEQIGAGLALNSTQFNLSRIIGPSIAGLLLSSAGALACFAVSAASYVPFIGVALWILPRRAVRSVTSTRAVSSREGLRRILAHRDVRCALLTVLTSSVWCAPLLTFTPVLVRDGFHGTAAQFSTAVVAFGFGGLLGAALLLSVPPRVDRGRLSLACASASGLIVIGAALAPWWWAVPVLCGVAGLTMTISNTAANTLLQASAPAEMLGEAVSLYLLAMSAGLSIGAVVTGVAASALGVRPALLFDGVAAVAILIAIARRR